MSSSSINASADAAAESKPPSSPRGARLKRDVLINIGVAVGKVLTLLLMVRVAILYFPASLGVFLIARRMSVTGSNYLQCGASQTLYRYIAFHHDQPARKLQFALLGLLIVAAVSAALLPLAWIYQVPLSQAMFPDQVDASGLAFWSVVLMMAIIVGYLANAVYLSERHVAIAGFTELWNMNGFVLLWIAGFVLLFPHERLEATAVVRAHALGILGLSGLLLLWFLARTGATPDLRLRSLGSTLRIFVVYGCPRSLVAGLDSSLLLVGPWMLRHDSREAGFLLVALMLVRAVQSAMMPLSRMAGVVAARLTAQSDDALIASGVRLLVGSATHASVLGLAVLIPWLPRFLQLGLGPSEMTLGVTSYALWLVWVIPPFAWFQGLKRIIEVRWFQPLNLISLIGAVLVQAGMYLALQPLLATDLAVKIALVSSFWLLGGSSLWILRASLPRPDYWGFGQLTLAALAAGGFNSLWAANAPAWIGAPCGLAGAGVLIWFCYRWGGRSSFLRELSDFAQLRSTPKSPRMRQAA